MTMQEMLLSNLEYYTQDPNRRCINLHSDLQCLYNPDAAGKAGISEGCGIGRWLSKEAQIEYDQAEEDEQGTGIEEVFKYPEKKAMAPEWMQNMDVKFLAAVQGLHDTIVYWDENGLRELGKNYAKAIVEQWNMDETLFEKYLN